MIEERLLILLRSRANDRGLVTISESALVRDAEGPPPDMRSAIQKLARAGLIEILAPLPFLVVKVRSWSGSIEKPAISPPAYSYSKLSNNRLNESYRPTASDALLREILDTLGESDPTSFEGAITNFPPEVIRKALDRVRRTRHLRKNRTALFRYLLTKLS